MSRYAVNKVLWQVARNDAHASAYLETPEQFPADRPLTDTERQQLLEHDFAGMFAAGTTRFCSTPSRSGRGRVELSVDDRICAIDRGDRAASGHIDLAKPRRA